MTMLVACTFEGLGRQYLTPRHNWEYVQIAIVTCASGLGLLIVVYEWVANFSCLGDPGCA